MLSESSKPDCQWGPGTYQAPKHRCKVPCLCLNALSVSARSIHCRSWQERGREFHLHPGFPQVCSPPVLDPTESSTAWMLSAWPAIGSRSAGGGAGQGSSLHILPNLSGNFLWGFHSSVALRGPVAKSFWEEMLPWASRSALKTRNFPFCSKRTLGMAD